MRAPLQQFRDLKREDAALYSHVEPFCGLVSENVAEVDLREIKDEGHKKKFVTFMRAKGIQIHDDEYPGCGCTNCFDKRVARYAEAESQRIAVDKRLAQYFQAGLLDNPTNADKFLAFLDANFPGLKVVTPAHVDAFVAAKRNELQWAPKPAPAAPPPPKPAPVILSDGHEQLPIDTVPSTHHTVEQLKDLDHRQRGAKNPPASQPAVRTLPGGEPELPLDASNEVMLKASVTQLQDLSRRRNEGGNTWGRRFAEVVRR